MGAVSGLTVYPALEVEHRNRKVHFCCLLHLFTPLLTSSRTLSVVPAIATDFVILFSFLKCGALNLCNSFQSLKYQ